MLISPLNRHGIWRAHMKLYEQFDLYFLMDDNILPVESRNNTEWLFHAFRTIYEDDDEQLERAAMARQSNPPE